jgi:hypothetical protein
VCSRVDATCACYSNATHGYFVAGNCSLCQPGWSGDNCDKLCPTHNGVICAGVGVCYDGLCFCKNGYCSTACEKYDKGCSRAT